MTAIFPINGIRLAATAAGIKHKDRDDVVLLALCDGSTTAAVFTQNAFCAAPVTIARKHLSITSPRYLLINSGNANAGTGDTGYRNAMKTCQAVATVNGCAVEQVLPFSTGVIGQQLDTAKFSSIMPQLSNRLDAANWEAAAKAIMTTDTVEKIVSRQVQIGGKTVSITGISKGSGMIHPNMATMLAYIATDAAIDQVLLQRCLSNAVLPSFNSITVDGDTSTNDACVVVASGQGALRIQHEDEAAYSEFTELLTAVCMELARKIVLDGEGATKLVTIETRRARSVEEARQVGFTIAHSPLVKTALFASDPNWGRILAAVGRAGLDDVEINKITIFLGDVCIVENGGVADAYSEAAGQAVMNEKAILIRVDLGRGDASAEILTCDLSYDYVKINAEYRT